MIRIIYLIALAAFFALSAFECEDKEPVCDITCSKITSLDGTWRLDYFRNTTTGAIDKDPGIKGKSVVFTFSDDHQTGTIKGHTFVNSVSGTYTLGGGCSFKVTGFGGSKVGEPEWSRKAWLPADSSGVNGSYLVTDGELVLSFERNPEQFVFKKEE